MWLGCIRGPFCDTAATRIASIGGPWAENGSGNGGGVWGADAFKWHAKCMTEPPFRI